MLDENRVLLDRIQDETQRRRAIEMEAEKAHQHWDVERAEYKTELKRLELVIANGKKGLAGVIEARQNSVIGKRPKKSRSDEGKETVFEFLERSRAEEQDAKKTQRGE